VGASISIIKQWDEAVNHEVSNKEKKACCHLFDQLKGG
jgi:hypothetical protein